MELLIFLRTAVSALGSYKKGKRPLLASVLHAASPPSVSRPKELANAGSRSAFRPGVATFILLNKR